MASSSLHSRRNSMEHPPTLADILLLRDEFLELYERDFPQLQRCIQKLCDTIRTFEKDLKDAAESSRNTGVTGIAGASVMAVGLVLAPFTGGTSLVGAGAGAVTLTGAGIKSAMSSFDKKHEMTKLRKYIEAELKNFQENVAPMGEKMKDIQEHVEKILSDLQELEREAGGLSGDKRHRIRIEDIQEMFKDMSETTRLIATLTAIVGGFSLFLDVISVKENNRAVNDMEKLEKTAMDEEIDESKMESKAGKFIVGMRKLIPQLQKIINELSKTKSKMAAFDMT